MKKTFQIVGRILTIVILLLIALQLANLEIDYQSLLNWKNIRWIALFSILYGISLSFTCTSWKLIIEQLCRKKIQFQQIFSIYAYSNIMKYIPGNVFQYIGRNALAITARISHVDVGISTILDIVILLLAGIFSSLILCGKYAFILLINALQKTLSQYWTILLIIVIVILFISIIILKNKVLILIKRYKTIMNKELLLKLLLCFFLYILFLLIYGILYLCILNKIFFIQFDLNNIFIILGATIMAWLLGFITPGSPGGIGIREMSMSLIAGELLNTDIILISMITLRIVTTFGDVILFLISILSKRVNKGE